MTDDQIDKLINLLAENVLNNTKQKIVSKLSSVDAQSAKEVFKLYLEVEENKDYIKGVEDTLEAFVKVLKVNQEPTPPSNRKN